MKYFFLVCALFSGFISFSQDCHLSIKGRILDRHDEEPLVSAVISMYGTNKEFFTDKNGYFIINSLCSGYKELEISHPSCGTEFVSIKLEENLEKVFYLEHHIEVLEEIALVQSKKDTENPQRSLNSEILEAVSGESFAEALTKIQGISTLKTGNAIAKPLIQGFYGSRVITSNQGVRMQDMEWGDEHAPNIATASVNNVSLVIGAKALQYGTDAVGGVLVLAPKKPTFKDEWRVKSSLQGQWNGRGVQTTQQIEKNNARGEFWGVQLDYKKAGNTQTPHQFMENTGLEQLSVAVPMGIHKTHWGLDAYLSLFKANNGILRNAHIGNTSDLIAQINGTANNEKTSFSYAIENPKQQVQHMLAKLSFYKRFQGLGKLNLQYDFQQNKGKEFDLRLGERRNIPGTDLSLKTHGLQAQFALESPQTKSLEFGLDGKYQIHFPNPDTGVKRLIPDYTSAALAAFVYGKTQLSPEFKIEASVRAEHLHLSADKYYKKTRWESLGYNRSFSQFFVAAFNNQILTAPTLDFTTFSTAFSAVLEQKNSQWQFHYQYVERPPNPAELFSEGLHHSAARIELGALDSRKEKAHKLSLQYTHQSNQNEWFVSPFYNHINDYIALLATDVEYTIRGAFPVWQYTQTNARFAGLDFRYSRHWTSQFTSRHAFSAVKAKDLLNQGPFPNIPPLTSTQTLEANIASVPGLSLGLEALYVFEQNETPNNIFVYDPYDQTQMELAINDPEPAYFLLKSQVQYRWSKKENTYTLRLIGDNLTNLHYHNYLNRLRYFSPEMGLNVQIQFTLEF